METIFYLFGSLFLIYFGYVLTKIGITAFRNDEKPIGLYDPKMSLLPGIVLVIAGLVSLVWLIVLPLFQK